MYHHRYQPPTNLANKTAAFASHNYPNNYNPSSAAASAAATRLSISRSHPAKANNIIKHHQTSNNSSGGNSSYSHAPTSRGAEDRQDVIFRKVRGILNKITPETFDKLSKELVNVGLNSPRTLRGVIYLLFDKALKDLKYSSLYAKLCQELSEKAPNFEEESGPNTFCKFLISKCEDEFERRRKATEDFDRKNDLTDEEYEQRAIAKQKMLGNIKFICELGKKRLLQEEILHECIRGLLSKKKERSIQDQAQDLECLCQIMRTIGSLLDIQASRNLMNQYFERIDMFSKKPELPSRIRFMLRDVIDLRNNNWRPRPFQREDNVPQPLSKLREEAGYDPGMSSSIDKFGNNRNLIGISDLSKLHGNKLSSLLLDDEPSFTTSADFHWGPSFLSLDHPFDPFSMGGTTNKLVQKQSIMSPWPVPSSQLSAQTAQKSSNFRVNDPFHEFGGDRRLDSRPNFTRPNAVNQQRLADDFAKLKDGSPVENRHRPEVMSARVDVEMATSYRPRQQGFAPYIPPKIQREDPVILDESRRPIEPRPMQQIPRGQPIQQYNRPIIRRQELRDSGPPQSQDGHDPAQFAQNRLHNHHVESRNPLPVLDDAQGLRDRRPFNQDTHQEQNSRFPNNYRPARPDRAPRGRESFQFERSNNESETNQNWRAGPPSSTSSVTSRNSSNPPLIVEHPASQRPNTRFFETNGQEGQTFGRGRNNGQPLELNSASPTRSSSMQSKAPARDSPNIPSIARDNTESTPGTYAVRNEESFQRVRESRADHTNRPISRHINPERPQHFERGLNISPPRPRNYDLGLRHQTSANENFNPPAHKNNRHNHRLNQSDVPETLNPSHILSSNQPHRNAVLPFLGDASKNQPAGKNVNANDMGLPTIDRRIKPLSRSNNPSVSSDIHDPDRVSNWRKGGNYNPAPQQTVKTPTKEIIKPQLSTSILPKQLPKKSDANFSLRPSHNFISARAPVITSKPVSINDDKETLLSNEAQASSGIGKQTAQGQTGSSKPNFPGTEKSTINGTLSSNETHNKSARDFHVNKFISVLSEHSDEENYNITRMACKVKELKIPKSYQPDCLVSAIRRSIFKTESDRENTKRLLAHLLPNTFETVALFNAFKIIFEQLQALEAEIPKVKSLVAGFLSQAILDGLLTLEELGAVLSGGRHHPLFLLCLQKLENSAGQAWLNEKFINSKIDLMAMLPEVDRSKDRLASVLKDRCLGFLDPMLTIEPDLWEQMKDKDPSPAAIYRWIKDNVSPTIQETPTFAHVLITCLVRYIHNTSAERIKSSESLLEKCEENPQSNKSSPSSTSQGVADIEKELLSKYQQMLQAVLKDKQMQLATLYSLQSFYQSLDFPKGALLRLFHQMYDLNVVDDEVFFTWKEEINDKFPGKGQALFQVNTWLNWLAEAESEEEEEV